ncbi:MAG: KUP/HAK/KT family potassium transporter [Muribaculaceae bacterium]|nr:KUP/HAK/KT family potassium transporter [Muribaculaceae bacterium]
MDSNRIVDIGGEAGKSTVARRLTFAGILVTVGIVFGDIGTSPLYVMKAITGVNPHYDADYVLGAISCVIWTLTMQTTVKYVVIALRADNKGEGGILALFALLRRLPHKWTYLVAAIGAAALIADGMITPAVTVTSAIEGLSIVTDNVPVVPVVVVVILGIFLIQQAGTGRIGRMFGPFMMLWFLSLGVAGMVWVWQVPSVLRAFNPWYAVRLMVSSPEWFLILGAVFLCTTGAEALYSDLGHCGRRNIAVSWCFVKVMLILNYLGQGAWLISHNPASVAGLNPFYAIVPHWLTLPAVLLATGAAVIASQALLSGAFTIFSEAVNLDFWPKLRIKYPSEERGQLYIPAVNWALLAGCLVTVLLFRDSSHMEAAYGLAITITMLMTTLLLTIWMRMRGVGKVWSIIFFTFFVVLEGVFFVANLFKFTHGGWYTLLAAGGVGAVMVIWHKSSAVRGRYTEYRSLEEAAPLIEAVSADYTIPKFASNLVYLSESADTGRVESKLLYSIINKRPKRADHYWFVNVDYVDAPDELSYDVKIVSPGKIFMVTMHVGYRVDPRVSLYLRQVVEDLVEQGALDLRSGYPSLRAAGVPGDFRFVLLRRVFSLSSNCRKRERFLMRSHDRLHRLGRSDSDAYGLDTSLVTFEAAPLILNTAPGRRIRRNESAGEGK